MTTVAIFVYLADVLQSVMRLLVWIGAFSLGWFGIKSIIAYITSNDDEPISYPSNWFAIGAFVAFFSATLIPQEKTMYIMAGAQIG